DWEKAAGLPGAPVVREFDADLSSPVRSFVVYAATSAGVYKSTNGGGAWAPRNGGLGVVNVQSIAVLQAAPQTVWAATAAGGVYLTVNGGVNWVAYNAGWLPGNVRAVAIGTGGLPVAGTAAAGVYGWNGANWAPLNTG